MELTSQPTSIRSQQGNPKLWRTAAIAVLVLVLLAAIALVVMRSMQSTPANSVLTMLTESQLEEQYGLRVRLIGVTAAGGMVDFRLKIVDAEKASQLLLDAKTVPSLVVKDSDVTLIAPLEAPEEARLQDGGVFFVLFSNSGGAVRPGTPVMVQFGDIQVGPFIAQ